MANLYCKIGGTGSAPYGSWANAGGDPAAVINAAAAGDTVYVQQGDYETSVNKTVTLDGTDTAPVTVICVNDTANEPPQTLGSNFVFAMGSGNTDLAITGKGRIQGLGISSTGSSSSTMLTIGSTSNASLIIDDLLYQISSTNTSSSAFIQFGYAADTKVSVSLNNPTITFGNNAGHSVRCYCPLRIQGGSFSSVAVLTTAISSYGRNGAYAILDGVDFSGLATGSNIVGDGTINSETFLSNCKLGSANINSAFSVASGRVLATNCSASDVHYEFYAADSRGTLAAVTTPYFDTGAKYDGTNPVAWKIVTSANASFSTPFVTPWIEKYHSGTSAITPYLEILRNDSTTAFTNAQVWGEFSAQAVSGSVLSVFKSDKKGLLSSNANQDNGAGLASWTGEGGSAWSGKIDAGSSVTPAEIGMLRARVCVGAPNATVYVDPFIRT